MRRIICSVFMALLGCFCLIGCNVIGGEFSHINDAISDTTNSTDIQEMRQVRYDYFREMTETIVLQEKNYTVTTDKLQTAYYCIVKDDYGNVIDFFYTNWKGVTFSEKEGLLCCHISQGGPVYSERYYDTVSGKVSRMYQCAYDNTNELVAYPSVDETGEPILVISNIFDSTIFQSTLKRNFGVSLYNGGCTLEFSNRDSVVLTYLSDTDEWKTEEWFFTKRSS